MKRRELQKSSERRRQLSFENSEIKAQITDKIGQLSRRNLEPSSPSESHFDAEFPENNLAITELREAIENLKVRLRESERRSALESLRYEELLLELESSQMRQRYENFENAASAIAGSGSIGYPSAVSPITAATLPPSNDLVEYTGASLPNYPPVTFKPYFSEENRNPDWISSNPGYFQADEEWGLPIRVNTVPALMKPRLYCSKVPAPRGITLEKQLTHSIIVSWKPPEFLANYQEEEVTAYHVYADGQFRTSVSGHEKCRALVDNIDASKQHRISIRTVTGRGQSKDAECTLLVGKGASAAPTRLKASHITTNSVKLSWLPGSSNFYHAVYLNDHELRLCPPGIYKLYLTGLPPDTLHRVRVEARRSNGPNELPVNTSNLQRNPSMEDHKRNSVFIEFHTAPIGLPDPPRNVQVEAGPQDGVLLISWRPVPQATHVLPNFENEPLVHGYTVCINDQPLMDVPGVDRDHILLPLSQLATLLKSPEFTLASQKSRQHRHQHIPPATPSHRSRKSDTTATGNAEPPPIRASDSSQSTGDSLSDLHNEEDEGLEDQEKVDSGLDELWLTVHSTLPANIVPSVNRNGTIEGKNGASGPASPPIKLIPTLLLIAAGSLEAAVELFGKRLSKRLGLNENNAAAACVSLRRPKPVYISIEKPSMDAERSDNADSADDDPGIVQVYAGNIAGMVKTGSPTSDALDSAEALLRERQLQKHQHSDPIHSQRPAQQAPSQFRHEAWSVGPPPSHYSRHPHEGVYHAQSYHNYRHRYDNDGSGPGLDLGSIRSQYYYLRRSRSGRHFRPTRSMSDENDCFEGGGGNFNQLPYSTESTESEHQHPSAPLFASAKSTVDLRADELNRRGRYVCRWHRSSPLRHYTDSRVSLMRRSKSLGRPRNSTLISSSSNDEGISKAYFQRLQEREISRDLSGGMGDIVSQRFTRSRRQFRAPSGGADFGSEWDQEQVFRRDKLRVGKSSPEKLASKHWLQKITSVPEIRLGRGYAGPDDHARRHVHPIDHQTLTDSPHFYRRFSGTIRDRQRQYQQHQLQQQRRGKSWREEGEELDRDDEGEEFLEDEELVFNRFDGPDDAAYHWSEEPDYPPSANFRNRRMRHSDPVGRDAKSAEFPPRRSGGGMERDYQAGKSNRKGSKRGRISVDSTIRSICLNKNANRQYQPEARGRASAEDRRPKSSPSLRQTPTSDGCIFFVSLYDYDPATMSPNPGAVNDELPFREGDIIKAHSFCVFANEVDKLEVVYFRGSKVYGDCDEDGFYFGECNGRKGLVPSNMVCEASAEEVTDFLRRRGGGGSGGRGGRHNPPTSSVPIPPSSLPPGQMTKPHRSTAGQLHDQPPGQMDRGAGYYHHQGERGGRGRPNRERRRRSRPGRVVAAESGGGSGDGDGGDDIRDLEDPGEGPELGGRKRGESQKTRPYIMEALYDYDPHIYSPNVDVETELKFRAGDRIIILSEMDEDGFYAGQLESSGRRGLVPSNFLREISRSKPDEASRPLNGVGVDSYDSRRKTSHGTRVTSSRVTKDSRKRGTSASRSRLQLEEADRDKAPSRRRRTREDLPRQLSRSHSQVGDLEDAEEEEEEDSMITSTVPPASPSDWVDNPDVKSHSGVSVPSLPVPVPSSTALQPPTLMESGSIRSEGNDSDMGKDSPKSDGQGEVIYMDINSAKQRKKRKSLSRNSSNEQSQDHGTGEAPGRRRSVFRSPFRKTSHTTE
ncbi:hypothetical protein Aperf_G00000075654 [Anoplocephala perfoliata]